MIHRELIPFETYTDEFGIPYIAELANACRQYISVSGVKNCFLLEAPMFLPNETKPIQLMFQKKGEEVFECTDNGTIAKKVEPLLSQAKDFLTELGIEYKNSKLTYLLYAEDNLRDLLLKNIQMARFYDDETDTYYYGILFPLCPCFGIMQNFNGSYTISQDVSATSSETLVKLCKSYDIEERDDVFYVTTPNLHTRYAIRRMLDLYQFTCIASKLE